MKRQTAKAAPYKRRQVSHKLRDKDLKKKKEKKQQALRQGNHRPKQKTTYSADGSAAADF